MIKLKRIDDSNHALSLGKRIREEAGLLESNEVQVVIQPWGLMIFPATTQLCKHCEFPSGGGDICPSCLELAQQAKEEEAE